MNGPKSQSRLAAGVSIPMAILLLIFFFLPWVNVQCAGTQIGDASGWQLAVGKITMDMPKMGDAEVKQEKGKDPDARPVFFLGLLLPLAIFIVGICSFKGSIGASPTGVWLTVLGVIGLIVMIMAANVDYSDEMMKDTKKPDQAKPAADDPGNMMGKAMEDAMKDQMEEQMSAQIKTEGTGILWTCLILYVLIAIAGASCFLKIGVSPAPAASQVPTAAAAPPSEPAPAQPPAQDQPPAEPPAQ